MRRPQCRNRYYFSILKFGSLLFWLSLFFQMQAMASEFNAEQAKCKKKSKEVCNYLFISRNFTAFTILGGRPQVTAGQTY